MRKLKEALPVTGMTSLLIVVLPFFLSSGRAPSPGTPAGYNRLKEGFANPSGTARAKVYWWWLNGYTDTLRLREELRAMKEAGIGGADIFEIGVPPASDPNGTIPAGPAFMSPASLAAIKFALSEAKELGLEMGLNLASSWNAGGSWVEPEDAAKTIYYSKTDVGDASGGVLKLSFPEITPAKNGQPRKIAYGADGKPVYYREIAVVALPSENKAEALNDTIGIVNVSGFFNAESQQLEGWAPGGSWTVYRFICANSGEQLLRPSPNSLGPIIDHFDSVATRKHLMYFINHLQPLVGDFRKSALRYFYLASYEAKEFAWTPSFPEAFRELNGYEVYKFLPALFDPERYDPGLLERFNHDFSETFSELMINNHYGKAKEICNRYGLKIISESGGPGHMHHIPVETLKALGAIDIPRGEFWYKRPYYSPDGVVDMVWLVKEIAAASHIYKRSIVEEEAFTSYRDWQEGPADLKPYADRAFCEGMNRLVIHGFPHNPLGTGSPGIAYFAGTHYNDKRVWWPKIKPFNDYLARISYILQQTDFVADVLYYYGEDIPNLVPPKNTRFTVGAGYDYEMINSEVLLKELRVEDGELVLPGVSRYKVLYIGEKEEISLEVLEKLRSLAEQGATILGGKPVRATGLNRQDDAEVKNQAEKLWTVSSGKEALEKGKIHSGPRPLDILQARGISPDFDYAGNQADQRYAPLDYIHYQSGENDFYLVRNTTGQWVSKYCTFRQHAKVPEIWDPVTGEILSVSIYNEVEKGMQVPLSFPPYGTYFVVFSRQSAKPHFTAVSSDAQVAGLATHPPLLEYTNKGLLFPEPATLELKGESGRKKVENAPEVIILEGPWTVHFQEGRGAPSSAVFPELISWTEAENDSIRYFSGTATYHKTFEYASLGNQGNRRVYLGLGDLAEVGEVWLNDQPLGITWSPPYRFDITDYTREGENSLRIEVANTWSNRLTGDAIQGSHFTRTNIVKANKNIVPWGELPLKESGLLGPVSIRTVQLIQP